MNKTPRVIEEIQTEGDIVRFSGVRPVVIWSERLERQY
jgi:hypothetical protein